MIVWITWGTIYLVGLIGSYKLYSSIKLPEDELEALQLNLPMAIIWPFSLPTILFAYAWLAIKDQIDKLG